MKKRVLVWLSWWVDSAVSAYLLQQQWYEVSAGFMKNFAEPENPNCHTREDRNMAIKVCDKLGIKTFIITDFRKEYDERIIQYIFEWYKKWITPNPDVFCNNLIKFDLFLKKAEEMGFDYIATGHYAQIEKTTDNANIDSYDLLRGVDHNKDQSYFLSRLNQYQLSKSIFPIGKITKQQVREIAEKIWLPNADRKDSQWLCFIGNTPMKDFLKRALETKMWSIVDTDWIVVWKHDWAYFFTIGQSRGLNINIKAYVVWIDIAKNEVIVSYDKDNSYLSKNSLIATDWNWINQMPHKSSSKIYQAKVRYRQDIPISTTVSFLDNDKIQLNFEENLRAIAPWQIVVLYEWEKIIWSWIIS